MLAGLVDAMPRRVLCKKIWLRRVGEVNWPRLEMGMIEGDKRGSEGGCPK